MREPIQKMNKDIKAIGRHLFWMTLATGIIIGFFIAAFLLTIIKVQGW